MSAPQNATDLLLEALSPASTVTLTYSVCYAFTAQGETAVELTRRWLLILLDGLLMRRLLLLLWLLGMSNPRVLCQQLLLQCCCQYNTGGVGSKVLKAAHSWQHG